MNSPIVIGLREYANGPVVTSLGGGLKGTGVPFTLAKTNIDHSISKAPMNINGTDTIEFHGLDKNGGKERCLSTYSGRMIKGKVRTENNNAPQNVAKILDLLPEVAIRYTKLTILSFTT
jgi:hypothetical protein